MKADVRLGSTEIVVNKNGFGALPMQRVSMEEAVALVRRAFEGGITFLTRQEGIRTARRSWEKRWRASGTRCT